MSGFDPVGTLNALVSHALASGMFETVNGHEPVNAPGNGLTAAVWAGRIDPIRASGLDSTSLRVTFSVRVYSSANAEDLDAIDPNVLAAVCALMAAYSGDFTLAGGARNIDLLGANGVAMSAQAGYLDQDGAKFRVMTISVPIIYNDVFEQVP